MILICILIICDKRLLGRGMCHEFEEQGVTDGCITAVLCLASLRFNYKK